MVDRKSRLNPTVGAARQAVAAGLVQAFGQGTVAPTGTKRAREEGAVPFVLVAVSGGPDSMALAALIAHFARRGDVRAGAVVVDHGLQEGSAEVASTTASALEGLGLAPVIRSTVRVESTGQGPEHAARSARYGAYREAVAATGADAVLLGHTLDDQAETVLLGLARGSGTRSLAGMPIDRTEDGVRYIRPMLGLRRSQIEEVCEAEGLSPWYDPTNTDQSLMRARVRHTILPFLEEQLGGDVAVSLARTASIVGPDADYLSSRVEDAFVEVCLDLENLSSSVAALADKPAPIKLQVSREALEGAELALALDRGALAALHPALRRRVLALAVERAGGERPGYGRLSALDDFSSTPAKGGPLQMAGHVAAYKTRPPVLNGAGKSLSKSGVLVLVHTS